MKPHHADSFIQREQRNRSPRCKTSSCCRARATIHVKVSFPHISSGPPGTLNASPEKSASHHWKINSAQQNNFQSDSKPRTRPKCRCVPENYISRPKIAPSGPDIFFSVRPREQPFGPKESAQNFTAESSRQFLN